MEFAANTAVGKQRLVLSDRGWLRRGWGQRLPANPSCALLVEPIPYLHPKEGLRGTLLPEVV